MNLCTYVSEERGDGECVVSETLSLMSYILKYIIWIGCQFVNKNGGFWVNNIYLYLFASEYKRRKPRDGNVTLKLL
jgi:hypothetical protein